jgi:transcriptional regulator with XRE-family HTH domain
MRSERAVLEDIGRNVRTLRKAHGLSQPALAALVGVSEQNIREIEKGKVNATAKTLIAIAHVFRRELFELCKPARSKAAAGFRVPQPTDADIDGMIRVGKTGMRLKRGRV